MNETTPETGAWNARRFLALLGTVVFWAIMLVVLWAMWPTTLGGSTSLVIVSGSSMEPTYSDGDLVFAREREPAVGDIIVYSPEGYGDARIVHRIIGGNGEDGWIVQGDNNGGVDPFEPTNDEVRGVAVVSFANVGHVAGLLVNPIFWAAFLLAGLVLLVWGGGDDEDDHDDQHSHEDPEQADADPAAATDPAPEAEAHGIAEAGAGVGGAVTRVVAVFALTAAFVMGTGGVPAFASGLGVNTPNLPATMSESSCATSAWGATVAGTPILGNYNQVQMSSIPVACQGLSATIYLYSATNTLLATATATPNASTYTFTTGYYAGASVNKVWIKVTGWPIRATWTATPPWSCIAVRPNGNTSLLYGCTVAITPNAAPPWDYDNGSQLWNYTFTVTWNTTPPNNNWKWRVTFNHAAAPFPGFTPHWVGMNSNPGVALAPGYSCTQQPIMVVQSANRNVWGASFDIGDGGAPTWFTGTSLCS